MKEARNSNYIAHRIPRRCCYFAGPFCTLPDIAAFESTIHPQVSDCGNANFVDAYAEFVPAASRYYSLPSQLSSRASQIKIPRYGRDRHLHRVPLSELDQPRSRQLCRLMDRDADYGERDDCAEVGENSSVYGGAAELSCAVIRAIDGWMSEQSASAVRGTQRATVPSVTNLPPPPVHHTHSTNRTAPISRAIAAPIATQIITSRDRLSIFTPASTDTRTQTP